jgi:hypothetical protein
MFGSAAAIDDKGGSQSSALKGMTNIGTSGELDIEDASVTTTGTLTNQGCLYLDNSYDDGGSTLSVGKTMVNEGRLWIGALNSDLSANYHRFRDPRYGARRTRQQRQAREQQRDQVRERRT